MAKNSKASTPAVKTAMSKMNKGKFPSAQNHKEASPKKQTMVTGLAKEKGAKAALKKSLATTSISSKGIAAKKGSSKKSTAVKKTATRLGSIAKATPKKTETQKKSNADKVKSIPSMKTSAKKVAPKKMVAKKTASVKKSVATNKSSVVKTSTIKKSAPKKTASKKKSDDLKRNAAQKDKNRTAPVKHKIPGLSAKQEAVIAAPIMEPSELSEVANTHSGIADLLHQDGKPEEPQVVFPDEHGAPIPEDQKARPHDSFHGPNHPVQGKGMNMPSPKKPLWNSRKK